MATQSPPFVLQNGSHSAALFREAVSSLIAPAGGVIGLGDLLVTQNGTPNMSVNVATGEVWIPGTLATGNDDAPQGQYFGFNDATVNLAIAAANVTNPRIDKVCATVEDAAYAGSNNDWKLQVITGTPTAGATLSNLNGAGATPANSLVICYVLVPASTTTIVTADLLDNRAFCAPNLPLRGTPSGHATANAASGTTAGSWVLFGGMGQADWLRGGMTLGSNVFTVPVAGIYRFSGSYRTTSGIALTSLGAGIWHNGSFYSGCNPWTGSGTPLAQGGVVYNYTDMLQCAAGDTLGLAIYSAGGATICDSSLYAFTNMSVHLVSI